MKPLESIDMTALEPCLLGREAEIHVVNSQRILVDSSRRDFDPHANLQWDFRLASRELRALNEICDVGGSLTYKAMANPYSGENTCYI